MLLEPKQTRNNPTSACWPTLWKAPEAPFTREDAVEAAWAVVDPVLENHDRAHLYTPGSWGPKQADALVAFPGPGSTRYWSRHKGNDLK